MRDPHGSETLKMVALEQGWKAENIPDLSEYERSQDPGDIIWRLYAIRDRETIVVTWRGNVQVEAKYNYGDYWLYPAWRSGVVKLLEGRPDPRKFSTKDKGQLSQDSYEEIIKTREVPWENDDVRAFDILLAVLDKEVHWVSTNNWITRLRTEPCPKASNLGKSHFRVYTTSRGLRVLEWANTFGFQACYVHNILRVN